MASRPKPEVLEAAAKKLLESRGRVIDSLATYHADHAAALAAGLTEKDVSKLGLTLPELNPDDSLQGARAVGKERNLPNRPPMVTAGGGPTVIESADDMRHAEWG
jgi:hypothetical protein